MEGVRESGEFKKLKWILRPKGPDYPSKRWGHTAVVHEGQLFIYGGNSPAGGKEGIHKIQCDSLQGDILEFVGCPEARQSHSCNLIKDSLYIFGGCINQKLTNDLLQFRVSQPGHYWRKIQQKNPIPPRESHVSLTLNSKTILLYGGTTPDQTMLDQFWLLDLQTASWHQVSEIKGSLSPKIGCTMTLFHSDIFVFGGEFGEGEDSEYSNDLYIMRFDNDKFSQDPPPTLTITKVEVIGPRPQARTGHCAINYKNRLLLMIGGEGVSPKKAPLLYNDIWIYNIKNANWAELSVQNRSNFRARTNFTANLHKNTIYVFGGFVNIQNFKCTDELATLTLHETKPHQPQSQEVEVKLSAKTLMLCPTCKFEYLPHPVPSVAPQPDRVPLQAHLHSAVSNILIISKTIGSPIEAICLLLDGLGQLPGHMRKVINITLSQFRPAVFENHQRVSEQPQHYSLLIKKHLCLEVGRVDLNKQLLSDLVYSYSYFPANPYFDIKNALFRLGKEVMISTLFQDEFLHIYLITLQGIFKGIFHKQAIAHELKEQKQHYIFKQFFQNYGIDALSLGSTHLRIIVGELNTYENGDCQLLKNQNDDLQYEVNNERLYFTQYLKEYFYQKIPITLKLFSIEVPLFAYDSLLKQAKYFRPSTPFFSEVRLLLNQDLHLSESSSFIKIYANNRRVGIYKKYPFIVGAVVLKDCQFLGSSGTKCENSPLLKDALEVQIQTALQGYKKRQNTIAVQILEQQACKKE